LILLREELIFQAVALSASALAPQPNI